MVVELLTIVGSCFAISSQVSIQNNDVPSQGDRSSVFVAHDSFFYGNNYSQVASDFQRDSEDYGFWFPFVLATYFDFYKNDLFIPEGSDFEVLFSLDPSLNGYERSSPAFYFYSYNTIEAQYDYVATFIDNEGLEYSLPNTTQYADDPFFFEFLYAFLTDAGFEEDTSDLEKDFAIAITRNSLIVYNSPGETGLDLVAAGDCISHGHYAVDNGLPAVATVGSSLHGADPELPYFVIGYDIVDELYGGPGPLLLYNPNTGMITANEYLVEEVTSVDFHGSHIHSDNISYGNGYCCPCGHSGLNKHAHDSFVYYSATQHVSQCSYCQLPYYKKHSFHYERLNNTWHRKYCSVCGYSFNELHSGGWCVCMLLD